MFVRGLLTDQVELPVRGLLLAPGEVDDQVGGEAAAGSLKEGVWSIT